jgi:uncharacterized LabA/DUF88 family protein
MRALLRAHYYATMDERTDLQSIRPLTDWLSYNGFHVKTKPRTEFYDREGRRSFKRNIGVELSVDALEIAKYVGHIVLFSGDGDFCSLMAAVQRRGPTATVVSSARTKPAMVADELRRQADAFLELGDLQPRIGRALPAIASR